MADIRNIILVALNTMIILILSHRARMRRWRRLMGLARRHFDLMIIFYFLASARQRNHLAWVYPRPETSWFEHHTLPGGIIPERLFKQRVRISKATFYRLLEKIKDCFQRENTRFRKATSPEKMLSLTLYQLAQGTSFVSTADANNVGETTAKDAFWDVVNTLNYMKKDFIKFPTTNEEKAKCVQTFQHLTMLPNVFAAVDTTHIPIIAPENDPKHYFSRYQQYDISCQALCDGTTKFIHVAAGYPGSMHDARIYRRSKISTLKLDTPKMIVDGKSISPYL